MPEVFEERLVGSVVLRDRVCNVRGDTLAERCDQAQHKGYEITAAAHVETLSLRLLFVENHGAACGGDELWRQSPLYVAHLPWVLCGLNRQVAPVIGRSCDDTAGSCGHQSGANDAIGSFLGDLRAHVGVAHGANVDIRPVPVEREGEVAGPPGTFEWIAGFL